jgi:[ribosomal protein S5]-alanine N-acetyltransferase
LKIEDIYSDLLPLETERLILRKIKMEEVEDIHTYTSDPDVSKYSGTLINLYPLLRIM